MFASSPRRRSRRKLVAARVVGCGSATSAAQKHKHASAVEIEANAAPKLAGAGPKAAGAVPRLAGAANSIAASSLSKRVLSHQVVPKHSVAHPPAPRRGGQVQHFGGPVHLDAKVATVRFVRELVKNVPPPPSVPFTVRVRFTLRRIFFRGNPNPSQHGDAFQGRAIRA
jgi:hypothetical protein